MTTTADPRVLPLVALDPATITSMFAPITGGTSLGAITSAGGGLVNTMFRVTTRDGERYALRILAGAPQGERLAAELRLLDRLRDVAPVPTPVVIDERGTQCGFPFVIYRWIDGITLNECRRAQGAGTVETLAEPLGRLAAMVATARVTEEEPALRRVSVRDSIDRADAELASARVRERLGQARADELRVRLARLTDALPALDRHAGLVHGDFGGRNVLVRESDSGVWSVCGLLDWETAGIGSPLWDVGSLFRYGTRYSPIFRDSFGAGYRSAGGVLPDEWWMVARLIDVTRLVRILNEDRELPSVFSDCRTIAEHLLR